MILLDSSVWVEHLRGRQQRAAALLDAGDVLIHPHVIGELALGHLQPRDEIMATLLDLPRTAIATDAEVLHMIKAESLAGKGIGYIDAHLLAAVRLTAGASLWTFDKKLKHAAEALDLNWNEA